LLSLRLAISGLRHKPTRFALAASAMALAVALVVSITSGYASIERAMRGFIEQFVGSTDFEVANPSSRTPTIEQHLLEQLAAMPEVRATHARIEFRATPAQPKQTDVADFFMRDASINLFGVDARADPISTRLILDQGRWFEPGELDVIVLDENAVSSLGLQLGDTVRLPGAGGERQLQLVGVVRQIGLLRGVFQTGYVPLETAGRMTLGDDPIRYSKVRGEFNPDVDAEAFRSSLQSRVEGLWPGAVVHLVRDQRQQLDRNLHTMRIASFMGGAISLLAAAFIIFGSLSMGVTERRRQLSMLRAVGATRGFVARTVLVESLVVAAVGIAAGVPIGMLFVHGLDATFPTLFSSGVAYDEVGILLASLAGLSFAAAAGLLPAWQASRASPVEAMQAVAQSAAAAFPWRAVVSGAALASIDSLIVFAPLAWLLNPLGLGSLEREIRFYGHFVVGLPALMLGFLLLGPAIVWLVERTLGPTLAKLAGIRYELLRQQLSGSPWRSAGTAAALMVGLSILIVMQVQSTSALGSWQLPTRFPDVFILAQGGAGRLDDAAVAKLREAPELDSGSVMPVHVTNPRMGDNVFALAGAALPNATLFIGVDPLIAFDLMQLDFRRGNQEAAQRMMARGQRFTLVDGSRMDATVEAEVDGSLTLRLIDGSIREVRRDQVIGSEPGRYLILSNEFHKVRGYDVGDAFVLESGLLMQRRFEFVVVGIVWSPGLDVMFSRFDLSSRVQEQTASVVFGTIEAARRDFSSDEAFVVAARVSGDLPRDQIARSLTERLGASGLYVADVRELKAGMVDAFQRLVYLASTIAWAAMLVACLGVANTVVAAIQARRWMIGVLRSIGLTASELLRLVLVEAMLLGAAGAAMGLAAGLLIVVNARGLTLLIIGFQPPLDVPWPAVLVALALVIILAVLASLWPALRVARSTPLELLRAGRAS
jgi:putative ABC transport system permease protein